MSWPRVICPQADFAYDGTQLSPRWISRTWNEFGSVIAIVAGPCLVPTQHMVDIEDRKAGHFIESGRMVHVLAELVEWPISKTVLLQNLIILWILEILGKDSRAPLFRLGNDLYLRSDKGPLKLSVSIAAASASSSLIHLAVNVDARGAPVPAAGLKDLGMEELQFVEKLATRIREEIALLEKATTKSFEVLGLK